jgi:protein-S-isoprenylcysteine O-methyltransferase Ste14
LLLALGFLLRVWATVYFYRHSMRVISLEPQTALITSGPYRFSRNPLYLGGNVFIFFGDRHGAFRDRSSPGSD